MKMIPCGPARSIPGASTQKQIRMYQQVPFSRRCVTRSSDRSDKSPTVLSKYAVLPRFPTSRCRGAAPGRQPCPAPGSVLGSARARGTVRDRSQCPGSPPGGEEIGGRGCCTGSAGATTPKARPGVSVSGPEGSGYASPRRSSTEERASLSARASASVNVWTNSSARWTSASSR